MEFELPEDVAKKTGTALTLEVKRKIMGENAARLYNIDIGDRSRKPVAFSSERQKEEAAAV